MQLILRGMTKTDAINYFGSQAALAEALGVSRPAISQWSEEIPEVRQWQLRAITEGKLEVSLKLLASLGVDSSQTVTADVPTQSFDAFVASTEAV